MCVDGDPDGYALAINISRRHLKPGARHLITEMARRLANSNGGKSPRSIRATAKEAGIDKTDLGNAAVVLDFSIDGDLRDDVLGGCGLESAADKARERKRIKQERDAKKERLREAAPDLYARVADDDKADVDEAIAALEVREAKARAEAEASASEEKRKAHLHSVKLKECIDDGVRASTEIWQHFIANAGAILLAKRNMDEAHRVYADAPGGIFESSTLG
jgi:hypothetical protein